MTEFLYIAISPGIIQWGDTLDLPLKYRTRLDHLQDAEPAYKLRVAEHRLQFVHLFLHHFERKAIKDLGPSFSRRKAIAEFCALNHVGVHAFAKWLKSYQAKGPKGLLPGYGNRKGCSPYPHTLLPIIVEIIAPGDTKRAVYKKLVPICYQLDVKLPSEKTVGRLLEEHGLIAMKGKASSGRTGGKVTIRTTLDVDIRCPLSCLRQLCDFIWDCPAIAADAKEQSLKELERLLMLVSWEKPLSLTAPLSDTDVASLMKYRAALHKKHSAKATAILMASKGASLAEIVRTTGRHASTIREWIRLFNRKRVDFIEVKLHHPERDRLIEERRIRLIDILHTPPSQYGIKRTNWNYSALALVYRTKYGGHICNKTVARAVKSSGYTWRRARKVLTSPDPAYKAKIEKVLQTLRGLQDGEAFFFIDEAGPYRVKRYGGKSLTLDAVTLPERQKAKGKVEFIVCLEARTNQLSWRFTKDKTAGSIVEMIDALWSEYATCSMLYLTWDSISSHSAARLIERIQQLNCEAEQGKGPSVEIVPLPSRSQFLNVVEAVLSGMKRAVIHNSNFGSAEEMETAVDGYFKARNQHFQENPKRAGNKIGDKEIFDVNKLAGGLFKRM